MTENFIANGASIHHAPVVENEEGATRKVARISLLCGTAKSVGRKKQMLKKSIRSVQPAVEDDGKSNNCNDTLIVHGDALPAGERLRDRVFFVNAAVAAHWPLVLYRPACKYFIYVHEIKTEIG